MTAILGADEKPLAWDQLKPKFEPAGGLYLCIEVEKKMLTRTGIALPDGNRINLPQMRVIKAGPGEYSQSGSLVPQKAKRGDIVACKPGGWMYGDITLEDGVKYHIVCDFEILGHEERYVEPAAQTG